MTETRENKLKRLMEERTQSLRTCAKSMRKSLI